jgi:glycosyltransferase involved in cell wall biosynthesis
MGPLNGGMELPPAFAGRDSRLHALTKAARPAAAATLNRLIRGRLRADVVFVANDRTRSLLPGPARRRASELSDIGVVLSAWPVAGGDPPALGDAPAGRGVTRFLFVGRLVGVKGVDVLLDAFALVRKRIPAVLEIVGDGPERGSLAEQAGRGGHGASISFLGWLSPEDCARRLRACDVYVSASLQEAGGVAVLEAMACGRPVVATAWGGHLTSIDDTAGLLVDVSSRAAVVQGLADAMLRLAGDAALRSRLGAGGRSRVAAQYDWDVIVDRILRVYGEVCGARGRPGQAASRHAS